MADELSKLPRLSWRGIEVPISSRSASFEQDDVVHKFEWRDRELIESQGVRNWRFRYTIPFREGITRAPYKNLFSSTFADFVLACRDRSPATLFDPVLGAFRAKVSSFSDDTDVHRRDGDDVEVNFIEAPQLGDIDILAGALTGIDAQSNAKSIDAAVKQVDWQQEPSPEPTVDALSALDGFGRQIEAAGDRAAASYEAFASRLQNVETTIDRLGDPKTWQLRAAVRAARYDAVVRAITGESDTKGKIRQTVTNGGPVAVVAQSVRMGVQAFLALNQELSRLPLIPQNTTIRYIQVS